MRSSKLTLHIRIKHFNDLNDYCNSPSINDYSDNPNICTGLFKESKTISNPIMS